MIEELIKSVFREANKQSSNIELVYRLCALRCLSDAVQFSSSHFKDNYFEQFWSNFVNKNFEENMEALKKKETNRFQILIDQFEGKNEKTKEEKVDDKKEENVINEVEDDLEEVAKKSEIKNVCLEIIGKCWPYSSESQEKYLYDAVLLLSDFLNKVTWNQQMLIIRSLFIIFDKWTIELDEKNFDLSIKSMEFCAIAVINCIGILNIY